MEHIAFTSLEKKEGIKLVHIPAGGGGPAVTMLLGGHVEISCSPLIPLKPYISAGTIRALAVWGLERFGAEEFRNIPTLAELGLNIPSFYWISVFAPKKTPQPVVQKLRTVLKQSVEDKNFVQMISRMGEDIRYLSGEEFDKLFKEQRLNISDLLKTMK